MLQVTVNGEIRSLDDGMTVFSLLEHLELNARKVAVERNLAIVPKSAYAETALMDGDRLEIVAFVGGG